MVTTMHVLLARTGAMVVIVTATSLLGSPFPFTPRTNTILALVTVGIPIVFLALWARPCAPRASILADVARFTVPISITMGITCAAVYLAFGDRPLVEARTALVTVAVICGLAVLTLEPGDASGPPVGRARTWWLAVLMALAFGAVLAWPVARDSFELQLLSLTDFGIIAAVGAGWAALAHAVALVRRKDALGGGLHRCARRRRVESRAGQAERTAQDRDAGDRQRGGDGHHQGGDHDRKVLQR
jgi:cation-transporting ATPase E